MAKQDGGSAFPLDCESTLEYGMSLRAYAAIKLRVPKSGLEWLDEMIREAQRDLFAGQALEGFLATVTGASGVNRIALSKDCYRMADEMLAEGEKPLDSARDKEE